MSSNPRSSRIDGRRGVAPLASLALALSMVLTTSTALATLVAPPLPPAIMALAPTLRLQGGGELAWFGIPIYNGWYWSPGRGSSLDQPLALDLVYQRKLDGRAIAARSLEEIEKLGLGTKAQRSDWGEAMRGLFPDVAKGDRLTGVSLPPGTTRFFHNGRPIGEIDDRDFARAFFGIWLDPRTSRPEYRRRLLGEPD